MSEHAETHQDGCLCKACQLPTRDKHPRSCTCRPCCESALVPKRCAMCGETKQGRDFHRQSGKGGGRHSYCRSCKSAYNRRALLARNPDAKSWVPTNTAVTSPSALDVAWAAGFLEGEGYFGRRNRHSNDVTATQVEWDPLIRLVRMFGGSVAPKKTDERPRQPALYWRAYGARARGIMWTVYPFMSPKRQKEIRESMVL